jgi:hypothetical protein
MFFLITCYFKINHVAGGVFRGVITALAEYIASGNCEYFDLLDSQEVYFGLKGHLDLPACRTFYRASGRALGLAMWHRSENVAFPVPFAGAVFKLILGLSLNLDDLDALRPQNSASIKQICLMEDADVEDLAMSFEVNITADKGFDLVPKGGNVSVTGFNRYQFLEQTILFVRLNHFLFLFL